VEWLVVSSDANILIYSLIECDYSPLIHKLRDKDSDWRTTALCLHETLNVLATYQRREVLTLTQCRKLREAVPGIVFSMQEFLAQ
jgi:predicted nucleic acid-binding protein